MPGAYTSEPGGVQVEDGRGRGMGRPVKKRRLRHRHRRGRNDPAREARQLPVDFGRAADLWQEAQMFLRAEFGL